MLSVEAARYSHLGSEFGQRSGKANHHVMEENRFDPRQQTLPLRGFDLGQKPIDEGLQDRFGDPMESRTAIRRLLPHEAVELGKCNRMAKNCILLRAQSLQRTKVRILASALV